MNNKAQHVRIEKEKEISAATTPPLSTTIPKNEDYRYVDNETVRKASRIADRVETVWRYNDAYENGLRLKIDPW